MFQMTPVGEVQNARIKVEDDYWGGMESRIVLADSFAPDSLEGIEQFSHAEIIYVFHQVETAKIVTGARHPRNNPGWPKVGIFAQRGKDRPNRIGSTIVRIIRCDGRTLYIAELDAINGTPVLDIKPVVAEFLPRDPVKQPTWSRELMKNYWTRPT